jgi:hypothetical protein
MPLIKSQFFTELIIVLQKFTVINIDGTYYDISLNRQQKKAYLDFWIELQISLINILRSKGPKVEPSGTPDFTTKEKESIPEIRREECLLSR